MKEAARYFIGLMSGTSADGMDAVLISQQAGVTRTHGCYSQDYSAAETQLLRESALAEALPVNTIMTLDRLIAEKSVAVVQGLLAQQQLGSKDIIAIGSHGHTLRHHSQPNGMTWQIGDPAWIVEHTGITCVADFRRRDVAAGGHGAPLVPAFHQQVFGTADISTMVLNIGGIANITVLAHPETAIPQTIGFDAGPGNALMDEYCQTALDKPCDYNGSLASNGKVQTGLLQDWLNHPYLQLAPPKSTGREVFMLSNYSSALAGLAPADALATLTEFTALCISAAVRDCGHQSGQLLVCGGGVMNDFLMSRLQALLPQHKVESTERQGIHPQWVEAAAFGWLAARCLDGLTGNLNSVTGATGERILGAIYPA